MMGGDVVDFARLTGCVAAVWLIVAGFLILMYSQVRHEGPDMCGCDEHPANRANPGGICDSCWTRALDAGRCRLCGDAHRADDGLRAVHALRRSGRRTDREGAPMNDIDKAEQVAWQIERYRQLEARAIVVRDVQEQRTLARMIGELEAGLTALREDTP